MNKREIRNEFKLRKFPKGVFAVRCLASGEVWVASTGNLTSARTALFFMLRNGSHINKKMQAAWDAHGEAAFEFEILETFDEDVSPLLLKDLSRDRPKHWLQELNASRV
jgi:hypothetical protein